MNLTELTHRIEELQTRLRRCGEMTAMVHRVSESGKPLTISLHHNGGILSLDGTPHRNQILALISDARTEAQLELDKLQKIHTTLTEILRQETQ